MFQLLTDLGPRLEHFYHLLVRKGAKAEDQLFNINHFNLKNGLGKNMDHQPLRDFFRILSKECGYVISPHRFRYTIATDMMKRLERSLNDVQMLLGHSNLVVTLEYVEANIDSMRRNREAARFLRLN